MLKLIFCASLVLFATTTHAQDYYEFPHFWTSVGFCPAGAINHKQITRSLESSASQMNLRHIAALPTGAVTHVRIHWLLELLHFVQYTQAGVPIFDFDHLDNYIDYLDEIGLSPVVEFMANPGNIFSENPIYNEFLWEHFALQVVKRYAIRLGAAKLAHWRFETWNEPDLSAYNRLHFTVDSYFTYVHAVRRGLNNATRLYSALSGPAGLFKSAAHHVLCWQLLAHCSANLTQCPIDQLSYHRKGEGFASEVLNGTLALLGEIYEKYPNLAKLPLVNSEADPVAIWSEPREFQADVRYAHRLVTIVLQHWHAKVAADGLLRQLQALSHDNAFLSYHPHEFTQRTLLAHFRMNDTYLPYSQFIHKPVHGALGMLGKLGTHARDVQIVKLSETQSLRFLNTASGKIDSTNYTYQSWLVAPLEPNELGSQMAASNITEQLLCIEMNDSVAYIIELLSGHLATNPFAVWRQHGSPAYPNATVREAMRRSQVPIIYAGGMLERNEQLHVDLNVQDFTTPENLPWLLLLRICSRAWPSLRAPTDLSISRVTIGEIYLTWREHVNSTECLKTYEVWYRARNNDNWHLVSSGWHLPYPSFQYVPAEASSVNGFYKVRGIDLFNKSIDSNEVEYYEF